MYILIAGNGIYFYKALKIMYRYWMLKREIYEILRKWMSYGYVCHGFIQQFYYIIDNAKSLCRNVVIDLWLFAYIVWLYM